MPARTYPKSLKFRERSAKPINPAFHQMDYVALSTMPTQPPGFLLAWSFSRESLPKIPHTTTRREAISPFAINSCHALNFYQQRDEQSRQDGWDPKNAQVERNTSKVLKYFQSPQNKSCQCQRTLLIAAPAYPVSPNNYGNGFYSSVCTTQGGHYVFFPGCGYRASLLPSARLSLLQRFPSPAGAESNGDATATGGSRCSGAEALTLPLKFPLESKTKSKVLLWTESKLSHFTTISGPSNLIDSFAWSHFWSIFPNLITYHFFTFYGDVLYFQQGILLERAQQGGTSFWGKKISAATSQGWSISSVIILLVSISRLLAAPVLLLCCLGYGRGFAMNAATPAPKLILETLFWCNLSLSSAQITSGTFCFQYTALV